MTSWLHGLLGKLLQVIGIVLIPVLLMLLYSYGSNLKNQEEAVLDGLTLTAETIVAQIETLLDGTIGLCWAVANDPLSATMAPARIDPLLKKLAVLNPNIESIGVFDPHGENRGYGHVSMRPEPRFNIADLPHFKVVMVTNMPAVSGLFPIRKPAGITGIAVAVPIRGKRDQVIGVVSVIVSADKLSKFYEETRLRPGQTILLGDQSGKLIFHTGRRHLSAKELTAYRDLPELRSALSGQPSIASNFLSPLTHDRRIGTFVPMRKYSWVVGVTMPRELALAPVNRDLWRNLAFFSLLVLFSCALAVLLAKLFIRPVLRLEQAALALGHGDLAARVRIKSGDELEGLGMAFNEMADGLQERERDREKYRSQQAQIEALKQADVLKDQFLSMVSHELRTPINAISGFSSILDDEVSGPLNEKQHEYVQKILQGSDILLYLINDLLDMSRIQVGKFSLSLQPANFPEIVERVLDILNPLAAQKQLKLLNEVPVSLPPILADDQRLAQVLVNLVGNAIKFTPKGGKIWLRARVREGFLACEIVDTGCGIAPEDIPKLFSRFTQLESTIERRIGGTGLGLSISKAIVEAHGGHIEAESPGPGQGSTFRFSIPTHEAAPSTTG